MPQTELSERLEISQSTLSRWEKGRSEPSLSQLTLWAAAVGLCVSLEAAPG